MTWSQRRQVTYIFGFLVVLALAAFLIIRGATHIVPTCYDGKKNGDEVGVDCGGACAFYCKDELGEPKIRWVRFFTVAPGLIHAVAYIEHSYPNAAAEKVSYRFDIYDEKNNLIKTQSGTTYLGPMGRTAIVETLIPVGNTVPAIARFTFDGPITWGKIPDLYAQVVVKTDRYLLEQADIGATYGSAPEPLTRLTATLDNQSRITFRNIDVVAILYDKDDNAIAASKSVLDELPAKQRTTVYFTWPEALRDRTARVEILPRINPFAAEQL